MCDETDRTMPAPTLNGLYLLYVTQLDVVIAMLLCRVLHIGLWIEFCSGR